MHDREDWKWTTQVKTRIPLYPITAQRLPLLHKMMGQYYFQSEPVRFSYLKHFPFLVIFLGGGDYITFFFPWLFFSTPKPLTY